MLQVSSSPMNVVQLPFNTHLGLGRDDDGERLLVLNFAEHLLNHLGTLHASALFGLAEASSGEFLVRHRGGREDIGGVVRKAACKYSAPAKSAVSASSSTDPSVVADAIEKVDAKGRALITIDIEVADAASAKVGNFSFDWLLAKSDPAEI